MVQIIEENIRPGGKRRFAEALGNIGRAGGQALASYYTGEKENEAIKRETGANLRGITDPQARQAIMADQMKQGRRYREALASQQLQMNPKGQTGQQRNQSFQERLQEPGIYDQEREPEPVIRESQYEEEPRKRQAGTARETGQRKAPGRTLEPQPATSGKSFQLLDPAQIEQEGLRVADERTRNGIPTSREEGMQLVMQNENAKATHNQNVELERQQKQQNQRDYGSQAVASMEKLMPKKDVTDEHRAYFQRLGEEAARNGENESDFQKKISKEAFKFKDDLANIQKSFPSARLFNKIKGGFYGNTRKAEEEKADIRIKLKPLLEKGLYNTARKFLAKADFFPEEAESLIADLSETTNKNLSKLPNLSKESNFADYLPTQMIGKAISKISPVAGKGLTGLTENIGEILSPKEFSQENLSLIENNMRDIFANDPNTNLILLRKAYEDKGVDWRTFKNQMNKMVLNGEIKLNDDQMSQFNSNIDSPPEGYLDVLLRKSGLIGR